MEARDFKAGQRITISGGKYNGNGKVVKVLQKNVDVELDGGLRVRAHPSFLAPEGETPAATKYETLVAELPPAAGTIVKVPTDSRIAGLHVVIGDSLRRGTSMAKIAKLGGENGRYWTVPVRMVEVVDAAEVLV